MSSFEKIIHLKTGKCNTFKSQNSFGRNKSHLLNKADFAVTIEEVIHGIIKLRSQKFTSTLKIQSKI